MIPNGLFTQIFLIILAVAVSITFIKPTLAEIGATQDGVLLYQEQISKISDVNRKLQELVNTYNTVTLADQTRLRTYMPDRVDTIAVPRDLYTIALEAGTIVDSITYAGPAKENIETTISADGQQLPSTDSAPELHVFSVALQGSYSQIKKFIELTEQNAYPLEIQSMGIQKAEGGYLSAEIEIGTYDTARPEAAEQAI